MATILDKFNMKGQVAVVTGGAGLLGTQFCRTLAQAGAQVAVADFDLAAADKVAQQLKGEGLQAIPVGVDVTSAEFTAAMVAATVKALGSLDVLVCSAAKYPSSTPAITNSKAMRSNCIRWSPGNRPSK